MHAHKMPVHVTSPPREFAAGTLQEPVFVLAEMNVKVLGRVFVKITPFATSFPRLRIVHG
jgi:hypothetical protein